MAIEVRTQAELDKALRETNEGRDELVVCTGGGHFVLRESSSAELRGSSSAELWGSSSAVLRGSSSAELRGSSSAVLWESSSAVLWGSSSAVLRESSSAVLRESSSAELRESSSAELRESSSARAFSARNRVQATKHAVVMQHDPDAQISGGRVLEMHKPQTGQEWCEFYGVETEGGVATLFKAVNDDFSTQRGISYKPGTEPEAPDWDGGDAECGGGLHFSPHPKMAREFNRAAAHFIACPVAISEIVVHPNGRMPEKVKARRVCAPCWEVNIDGERIDPSAEKEAA